MQLCVLVSVEEAECRICKIPRQVKAGVRLRPLCATSKGKKVNSCNFERQGEKPAFRTFGQFLLEGIDRVALMSTRKVNKVAV